MCPQCIAILLKLYHVCVVYTYVHKCGCIHTLYIHVFVYVQLCVSVYVCVCVCGGGGVCVAMCGMCVYDYEWVCMC